MNLFKTCDWVPQHEKIRNYITVFLIFFLFNFPLNFSLLFLLLLCLQSNCLTYFQKKNSKCVFFSFPHLIFPYPEQSIFMHTLTHTHTQIPLNLIQSFPYVTNRTQRRKGKMFSVHKKRRKISLWIFLVILGGKWKNKIKKKKTIINRKIL